VIASFADRSTESLSRRQRVKRLDAKVQRLALRKLVMLDAATALNDLRVPPGNRLDALRGDRKGPHSIRINDQYRVCFRWRGGNAHDVQIVDYHRKNSRWPRKSTSRSTRARSC
jgi:proteic killer suppression protein